LQVQRVFIHDLHVLAAKPAHLGQHRRRFAFAAAGQAADDDERHNQLPMGLQFRHLLLGESEARDSLSVCSSMLPGPLL
jgi:hypothetical protein